MTRTLFASALVVMAVACSGGGVTVGDSSTTTAALATTTTTSTTMPATTTTTIRVFEVAGKVSTPEGRPVARANVEMGSQSMLTNADGRFSFETSRPSTVHVSRVGWTSDDLDWDPGATTLEATIQLQTVRGLRVSPEAAGDNQVFNSLTSLAGETPVNALVFDTKQEGGVILHEMTSTAANDSGAVHVFYDAAQRIAQAHANGLYAITRIVAFEDRLRVNAHPEEKLAGPWLDPASESARGYLIALAEEACDLGFDEIQFDYVRYPAGKTSRLTGQLDMTQEDRVAVIASFLAEARAAVNPRGCAVSADIFGIVVSTPDDQGLGQRPEELSAVVDAISPMIYPSHYSNGWLGYSDPNDYPYEVTASAISDGLQRMTGGATLRPWLQGFWWNDAQIREAIQAAEDLDVGWILWNIRSNYDRAALPAVAGAIQPH